MLVTHTHGQFAHYGFPVVAIQPPRDGPITARLDWGSSEHKKKHCLHLLAKYEKAVSKDKAKRSSRLEAKLLRVCKKAGPKEYAHAKKVIARLKSSGAALGDDPKLKSLESETDSAPSGEGDGDTDSSSESSLSPSSSASSPLSSLPSWALPVGVVGAVAFVLYLASR